MIEQPSKWKAGVDDVMTCSFGRLKEQKRKWKACVDDVMTCLFDRLMEQESEWKADVDDVMTCLFDRLMEQESEWKADVEATIAMKDAKSKMLQLEKEEVIQEVSNLVDTENAIFPFLVYLSMKCRLITSSACSLVTCSCACVTNAARGTTLAV